ncbi:hypothetical protein B0J14DRAFT_668174 [Halenospora varia]|nr:hypothetical protein B0J14DRAFT_668174 [Halenospora varia]
MMAPRSSYERDLSKLLSLVNEYQTALLVSSASSDGADDHVDLFLDIIREICDGEDNSSYKFKAISIYSNVSKTYVLGALRAGRVQGSGSTVKPLTESDVEHAVTIVAQIGPEPFVTAMEAEPNFNIIVSGRAYDPSPYSAFCIFQEKQCSQKALSHQQLGGFTHMDKVMECGGLCATPKSASAMATVYLDSTFDIKPLNAGARCTPFLVASHTLYEKTRPDILLGPGGELDLTGTSYIQLPDQRTTSVYGATFEFSRDIGLPYTVKLEAAKIVGYRSIYMGDIRDPILISQISDFQSQIREFVASQITPSGGGFWELGFHVYGKLAHYVAHAARIATIHCSYPGQRGTGGNFAMGVGRKTEVDMGPCGEFCIYHLIPLISGEENARRIGHEVNVEAEEGPNFPLFSWKMSVIGNGEKSTRFPQSTSTVPTLKGNLTNPDQRSIHSFESTLSLINPTTLADIAPVIRCKNAGPYEITLDVVFSSPLVFYIIKSTSLLSPSLISRLYDIKEEKII